MRCGGLQSRLAADGVSASPRARYEVPTISKNHVGTLYLATGSLPYSPRPDHLFLFNLQPLRSWLLTRPFRLSHPLLQLVGRRYSLLRPRQPISIFPTAKARRLRRVSNALRRAAVEMSAPSDATVQKRDGDEHVDARRFSLFFNPPEVAVRDFPPAVRDFFSKTSRFRAVSVRYYCTRREAKRRLRYSSLFFHLPISIVTLDN